MTSNKKIVSRINGFQDTQNIFLDGIDAYCKYEKNQSGQVDVVLDK
jgi:hypothetical protein